jgi:hypothetical protein
MWAELLNDGAFWVGVAFGMGAGFVVTMVGLRLGEKRKEELRR